jgi:gas vesicle protein
MKRLKGILGVLAIFLCGAFVGAVVGSSASLMDYVNKTLRGGPPNVRRILMQKAKHDLKLDEDQAHQFWQILNETGTDLRDALKPARPQIDAALVRAGERMRTILRDGQRPRFDSFAEDFKQRWVAAMADAAPSEEKAAPEAAPRP